MTRAHGGPACRCPPWRLRVGSGGSGNSRGSQSRAYNRVVAFKAFSKSRKGKDKAKSTRSRKQRDEELIIMLG